MVIVNGFEKDIPYRRCTKCVIDTTVPGVTFDSDGVCNYCKVHDKMSHDFPNDYNGKLEIKRHLRKIKKAGRGKKYDCVVGLSGGRDSCFMLYLAVKKWGLRPIAVHFNDGFDNPVGGENILKITKYLNVELRTITSDWRLAKDIKLSELKASTPQLNTGTDVGIGASLFGVASKEKIKYILVGQSFRTEGLRPISWSNTEGDFLRAIHKKFGTEKIPRWTPSNPGYNLGLKEIMYYFLVDGKRVICPFYNYNYVRTDAERIMKKEFGWVYPGGHYFDDLYWGFMTHIFRTKFNIDHRKIHYAALVRSGQMERENALKLLKNNYVIEDEDIIRLCIKRLGITKKDFDGFMALPPKHFTEYKNNYSFLKKLQPFVWLACKMKIIPMTIYDKWFTIGTGLEGWNKY